MPSYTVIARGGLLAKGGLKPTGSIVDMSEKDALSLPPGSVALKAEVKPTPIEPKAHAPKAKDKP